MNDSDKSYPYLCTHNESDPEHLTCIPAQQAATSARMSFLKKRYHTYYHPYRKNHHIHRIVDAFLIGTVIAGIAVVAYMQLNGPLFSNALRVSLDVDQSSVASGDIISSSMKITNISSSRLNHPTLILSLPPHFEVMSQSPSLPQSLAPRETITVQIKGIAIGSNSDRQTIKVSVRAENEKEGWVAYREQQISFLINDSRLNVRAELPSTLIPENPFNGSIIVENQSSQPLKDIFIQLITPSDISFDFFKNTNASQGISITSIEAHGQYHIPFSGTLRSLRQHIDPLSVIVSFNRDGLRITQRQTEFMFTAAKPFIDLAFHTDNTKPLTPGKAHDIILEWHNTSSHVISDIKLIVSASGFGIDEQSLASPLASSKKPFEQIWTQNTLADLKQLQPNNKSSLSFKLTPSTIHSVKGLAIDSILQPILQCTAMYRVGGSEQRSSCSSLSFQVNTLATVSARARYFSPEGDQIGHGPYPPRANMLTRYMVFLTASTSIHPLESVLVEAKFAPDSGLPIILPTNYGKATLNESNRTITWDIGTISSLLSNDNQIAGLVLDLPFTPKGSFDQPFPLITDIILTGKDGITGTEVRVNAQDITTAIQE